MELIVSWQSNMGHHARRKRSLLHLPDLRSEAESWLERVKWFGGSLLLRAGKLCFVMARYLSRADLSHIAGKYIDQYYTVSGSVKMTQNPLTERLASSVLGLNVKMLPLCSDGSILGLTVFQKCGFTVTLGDGTKLVEVFMPKDVVIDSALASDSCTGCRNFTIAHEAAHHILAEPVSERLRKSSQVPWHIAYRERNGQPHGKNGRRIPLQRSC